MSRRPIFVNRVRTWNYDYPSNEGTYYTSREIYHLKLKRFEHTGRYLSKNNTMIKIIGIDRNRRIWHYSEDAKRLQWNFRYIESYYDDGWFMIDRSRNSEEFTESSEDSSELSEESEKSEEKDYIDTLVFQAMKHHTKSGKRIGLQIIKSTTTNLEYGQKFFYEKHKFAVYGLDQNGIVWGFINDERVLSTINMSKNYDDLVKNGWSLHKQAFVGADSTTDEEIHQCLTCLDNQRVIAYGCGHVPYCISCHNRSKDKICPLCKTKIVTTLRIFY